MHRSLISLAVCVAGIGALASGPTPHQPESLQHHQVVAAASVDTALIRSGSPAGAAACPDGPAPAPRGVPRRHGHEPFQAEEIVSVSTRSAAFLARAYDSREYLSAYALARAGRTAAYTTTPPPFGLV